MLRILWQRKAAYFIAVQSCVLLRAQAAIAAYATYAILRHQYLENELPADPN